MSQILVRPKGGPLAHKAGWAALQQSSGQCPTPYAPGATMASGGIATMLMGALVVAANIKSLEF